MQTYTITAVTAASNFPLPGASLSVYATGTTTLASLYNVSGSPIANPMIADQNGAAVFQVADGTYDIVAQSGAYVGPTRVQVQIFDLATLASRVSTLSGLVYTAAVRFATTGTLPAFTYANGTSGSGATITANANGALSSSNCDGLTPAVNDRCWVWSSSGGSNVAYGLYVVTQVGSGSLPFILTRASDANSALELSGLAAAVTSGSVNAGLAIGLPVSAITVGTTALQPVVVGSQTALASEAATRAAADATLTTNLAAETTRAEGAEATLAAGVSALSPSLNFRQGASDGYFRVIDSNNFVLAIFGPNGMQIDGALDLGTARLRPSLTDGIAVVDGLGFETARIGKGGVSGSSVSVGNALTFTQALPYTSNDLNFVDAAGFVGFTLSQNGRLIVGPASGLDFGNDEIFARNARALALTSRTLDLGVPYWLASASCAYNLVMLYGQSLGTGTESWPAKTVSGENRSDVLMIGQSVRPGGAPTVTSPSPAVDTTLRAAVATVQNPGSGVILTSGAVAALSAGDTSIGEEVSLAATIFCRELELADRALQSDATRQWIVSNVAVPGQTIEELSKGASPNLYNRLPTIATAIHTAAGASTSGCAALIWMQGEYNYFSSYGGSTDGPTYKTNLLALFANFVADVCVGVFSQTQKPAVFLYQTGGGWSNDAVGLSIGEAQWELARDNQGWYLAAPSYPVTNKASGHLDPNGERWLACQFGKVMHQVLIRRKNWRPLSPISVEARGKTVLATFHVPAPPLQFQSAYEGSAAVMRDTRGFRVYDTVGEVPISGVSIVADAVLAIKLTRTLVGAANLYAGREEDGGSVDLCDSDPTIAPFNYEYSAGSGDYTAADITALVGNPYPLWNWCIAFNQPITVVS